jgi:hypothetical protein
LPRLDRDAWPARPLNGRGHSAPLCNDDSDRCSNYYTVLIPQISPLIWRYGKGIVRTEARSSYNTTDK